MIMQVHAELQLKAQNCSVSGQDRSLVATLGSSCIMEKEYPKASFSVSCVGDVCKGDEVLFNQGVFDGFDVRIRKGGAVLGKPDVWEPKGMMCN